LKLLILTIYLATYILTRRAFVNAQMDVFKTSKIMGVIAVSNGLRPKV